jgi:flagellar FliJ protein
MPTMPALLQLLDHERRTRDEAILGMRNAEGAAGQADAQAAQLNTYRSEYVERWSARFREPGSVTLMQCYQGFMQRLDQAIIQQRTAVEQAHARIDQMRRQLQDNKRRVASVEKLIERRQQQQQRQATRREQSHSDETAQRVHALRMAAQADNDEPQH